MIEKAAYYGFVLFFSYFAVTMTLAAAFAVYQESKIWKPKAVPSLSPWGALKVFLYNIVWMVLCLIGSVLSIIKYIITFGNADIDVQINEGVEPWTAYVCHKLFSCDVKVNGKENLPPLNQIPAPVYIANHASQLDIGAVYFIRRRVKWIAKKSVFYLPGVGQVMYFGKHIAIERKKGANKKSVSNLFELSDASVQAGLPVFFFPQGTRRIAEKVEFKSGAFIVAQNNCSTIVPLSIEIPENAWNSSYPVNLLWGGKAPVINVTIHESVKVTGKEDREALTERCQKQIYSILPTYGESGKTK